MALNLKQANVVNKAIEEIGILVDNDTATIVSHGKVNGKAPSRQVLVQEALDRRDRFNVVLLELKGLRSE